MEPSACAHQCFWWNDKIFCAVVMLFGWCLAPFYFTKICKVPSRFFGALLIKLLNYLDDFLFSGTTEKMEDISLFVNFVLVSLGWSFNDKGEKGTRVKFLGYILDSFRHCFEVPADKIARAQAMLPELLTLCIAGTICKNDTTECSLLTRSLLQVAHLRIV